MTYLILTLLTICFLYLYLIMPALRRKPGFNEINTVYFAHRGLHDNNPSGSGHHSEGGVPTAPENSLKSFELAIEAGYGIELDIQLSKDNQVIVFHDETLERMCGIPGAVLDYTYDELKALPLLGSDQQIPLLTETLKLVAGHIPLIIEYKIVKHNLTVCTLGDEILRDYQGPYVIESFHPFALRWYKKNNPTVIRGQLATRFIVHKEYRSLQYWLLQNLLLNFITKPDFIAFEYKYPRMWSRSLCRYLYQNPAVTWTITTPDALEKVKTKFDWFIFEGFDLNKKKI